MILKYYIKHEMQCFITEKRVENMTRRSSFDKLWGVGDETLRWKLDITSQTKLFFIKGEIKDAKMSSFSSDFQTLIKLHFPLYFLQELLMSLRRTFQELPLKFKDFSRLCKPWNHTNNRVWITVVFKLPLFAGVSSKSKEDQRGLKDDWLACYKHF